MVDKTAVNAKISLSNERLLIHTAAPDTTIKFQTPIRFSNPTLSVGLPIIIFLLSYILLCEIPLSRLTSLSMQDSVAQLNGKHRIELDGIRGAAALFVLLEHTWTPFLGMGRTGVWLFFILSGYLLSQPFVKKPARIFDVKYLKQYMIRRLSRIMPMYYTTVLIMFAFNGKTSYLRSGPAF